MEKQKIYDAIKQHCKTREDTNKASEIILNLFNVSKRYYWLKPDGEISNMWNEEDHRKYLTDKDIKDAQKDGWQLICINVC